MSGHRYGLLVGTLVVVVMLVSAVVLIPDGVAVVHVSVVAVAVDDEEVDDEVVDNDEDVVEGSEVEVLSL